MDNTMTCGWCRKEEETRVGLPSGWFTLKDPGEIVVCSTGCMDAVFDELHKVHVQESANWKAGK